MYSNKVHLLIKYTTSLIRLPELGPYYQFARFNRYYSKVCKYYGGYSASLSESPDTRKQSQQRPSTDSQGSLVEKFKCFKAQLTNLEDPLKKYDYLMTLRDKDLDLYYRFLREYTRDVLAILYAVDGVIHKFGHLEMYLPNNQCLVKENKKLEKPLGIANAMEYLRERISHLKEDKSKNAVESEEKTVDKAEPIEWIKKRFTIAPNKSYMIYLKTNNLK